MSLLDVYKELSLIAELSSTNEKIELLEDSLTDPTFKRVVKYALSNDMKFKIKKFPPFKEKTKGLLNNTVDNEQILEYLKFLSGKPGATNKEKQKLFDMFPDKETCEVVKRICLKNLKCGIAGKNINKALPGTINLVPYMRCHTVQEINRIDFSKGAYVQEKADGTFVNLMINRLGQIKIVTRNGRIVYGLHKLKHAILHGRKKQQKGKGITDASGIMNAKLSDDFLNSVYNGELVVIIEGVTLDRETGNGIINKCIHGTATKAERDYVHFRVWDYLPLKNFYNGFYSVIYNTRIFKVDQFVKAVNSNFVEKVETKLIHSEEEAWEFYRRMRLEGKEGAVLKNLKGVWKFHTSPDQIKMKNTSEGELHIVDWYYGKPGTDFEKCIGGIVGISKCKKLKAKAGSGLSHEDRGFKIVPKNHKNAMAVDGGRIYIDGEIALKAQKRWDSIKRKRTLGEFEYESVKKDKRNKKLHTFYLPRFKGLRIDKDEADTLDELKNR